jgi:DNA-binding NarL/FixJ family response regulator
MERTVKVAIIDSHTLARYGMAGLVAEQPDLEIAGEAAFGRDAVAIITQAEPDVVVLDAELPDMDSMHLARELRDRNPHLGIVLLTSSGQDDVLFRALESGASAFVTKATPVAELLAAIRHAAVAANTFSATGLATAMARRNQPTSRTTLSPREAEVLALLGQGLSIPAIAGVMFVSQSTAKTYVARLYDKLEASNRTQAIMAAMRMGLLVPERVATAS